MSSFHRHLRILFAISGTAAGLVLVPAGSAATAATGFCAPGASFTGTTITWTGKAHSSDWNDAGNWSPHTVPDVHHKAATYQNQYVCIGKNKSGSAAKVTIKGKPDHVAGIDVGNGAILMVEPGGGLFLGAATPDAVMSSFVRAGSQLQLLAGTLGGNAHVTVAGTLRWTGVRRGNHKLVATQTSSECVFDPSIKACPGDTSSGGGETIVTASGKLLVDGTGFGGAVLGDQRRILNSGAIEFRHNGFVLMNDGTRMIDKGGSSLAFGGPGGIYLGASNRHPAPSLSQRGRVSKTGSGISVVGVPVGFAKSHAPHIRVRGGGLSLQRSDVPVSKVVRAGSYGVGGCTAPKNQLCRRPDATTAAPQVATIGTSSEAAAPKVSKVGVALASGPAKVHGHRVLGQQADVTAPTAKTTHSTHLTFSFDAKTKGLPGPTALVYRNKHRITLCHVHGLTAKNTSCVLSEKVAHSGPAKGDLTVIVISIQPKASWLVAK
jgi:hypothetical protein